MQQQNIREKIEAYSTKVGSDPALTQGAGGNISWKEGDTLWIKASGFWLQGALKENIFLPVSIAQTKNDVFKDPAQNDQASTTKNPPFEGQLRPSIETALHAVMPHKVVVHLHPINALVYLVQKEGKKKLAAKLDSQNINWSWVDYRKPGPELAQAVNSSRMLSPASNFFFLANHGILVGGDTLEEVEAQINTVLDSLKAPSRLKDDSTSTSEPIAELPDYRLETNGPIASLANDPVSLNILSQFWRLYPDHLINKAESEGSDIDYGILQNKGVFLKKTLSENKKAMLLCFAELLSRLTSENSFQELTIKEAYELKSWDAEKYRIALEK